MTASRDAAASDVPRRNLLGYQPALDGLRGLALIAIFFFHAGFSFAPGAFLVGLDVLHAVGFPHHRAAHR